MNEQHFDALPPIDIGPASQNEAGSQNREAAVNQPEKVTGSGEQPGTGPVGSAAGAPVAAPTASVSSTDNDIVGQQMQAANPVIADDVDLIEKEWVLKAKHIVEQTKNDPYLQNQEMTKMKLDYLKKRYNRDIKISESQS